MADVPDQSAPADEPEGEPAAEPAADLAEGAVRAGFCAIVGLPNVGKSTLLNRMLGRHLVAVSAKPQTTRDRIVGVHTIDLPDQTPSHAQIAYVDTPGVQDGRGALRRYMREAAIAAASDADVVLLIVDATHRGGRMPDRMNQDDTIALAQASKARPLIVALNKVDRVGKPELLPVIEAWTAAYPGVEVVPISAANGDNVDALERVIASKLPPGPPLFPADMVTDRSPQFIAQEIIREQLYHQLGKELPYACAVQVETWTERKGELVIGAVIVVERESQKPIVVGRAGSRIKELGIAGRAALAAALGKPVHLSLFVKVRDDWSTTERDLRELGYGGDKK
jgi:GTP-binding protein Era